jgi:hypothetical protein
MAVTTGSFRKGEWKLTFVKGPRSESPEGRKISNAALYRLSEDLGEKHDLSESQSERKQQLFADFQEYYANQKLKPLAEQVIARKSKKNSTPRSNKKTKVPDARSPKQPGVASPIPEDSNLTEAQTTKVEALIAEYRGRRSELQKKQAELLDAKQKRAVEATKKKAIADGKKGMALRTILDAAAELTKEQQKKLSELRDEMGQLTREHREQMNEVLKDAKSSPR